MTQALNRTNLAIFFITALSAVPGYDTNKVADSLKQTEIILEHLKKSHYVPPEYIDKVIPMLEIGIGVFDDLESIGFKEYWEDTKKPLIEIKCNEFKKFYETHNFINIFNRYKQLPSNDINVYICNFHHPHGTKLYFIDNNVILSDAITNEQMLSNLIHEQLHCPYDNDKAMDSIKVLSEISWVIDAFKNQNINCRYETMEGFIEENIVEALGTYIVYDLGIEKEPYKYFQTHDLGSHVISPRFFNYILENPKPPAQGIEDYLYEFVRTSL